MARRKKDSSKKDLLVRARDCYKKAYEADQDNRKAAIEDLKFANEPGAQWDVNMKTERGDRPCYEFNKCRINGKKVINEIRANRPQGKVRAVEGGDKQIADIYEGLCRNIWASSDGDTVVDNAAEYQVDAGMTAWRVETKYSTDTAFDQDIVISGFKNPFCVYVDPNCKDPLKRDAEYWIVSERIANDAYDARWPKAERSSFDGEEFDQGDWQDDETTRICEYWYKEPVEKEIWLVAFHEPDGSKRTITVGADEDEAAGVQEQIATGQAALLKTRTVQTYKIKMCIVSGDAILEEAEWAGTQFPFVMIYGESKVVDGRHKWWGLHRFAKDAQRSYNVSRTAIDETIAQTPQSKYLVTPEQIKGLDAYWAEAHRKNFPFLPYNVDPKQPGPPVRAGGADVPVALIQQATIAAQDIRDTTGLHEASFGEESGEKSGIALARKQNQAEIVTYNFPDNIAKGIRRTWEIIIDLIPKIYDAERELRILGADGAEDYVKVNQLVIDPQTQTTKRVNDLSMGRYDVTITVGPSFSSQRQEAAEVYTEIGSRMPQIWGVAGDLLFKSMDLPYSEEIAERMQALLPPQIQEQIAQGKEVPPEAQAIMARANQAMQVVQQQTQLVQQAAQEVEQSKVASEQAKTNVEKAIAQLEVKRAQFDADVTKKLAEIAIKEAAVDQKIATAQTEIKTREADLNVRETTYKADKERDARDNSELGETRQAVATIDSLLAQYIESAAQAMEQIRAEANKRPKLKSAKTRREGGALVAEMEMDDGSLRRIRAQRQNGELVAVPEEAA